MNRTEIRYLNQIAFKLCPEYDVIKRVLSTTLIDSTEHIQGCLMTYDGACDRNMESHDGVVSLCRMIIWSYRYDPTTWAKECKTGYYFGKISHENKA